MTIVFTLRQQRLVTPTTFVVVHEITAISGVSDPSLEDNLKRCFLVSRSSATSKEILLRVATATDYVTYLPYPATSPRTLTYFKSDAFTDAPSSPAFASRIIKFTTLPDYWETNHNGSPSPTSQWSINANSSTDTVELTARLPSTSPGGEGITFELFESDGTTPVVDSQGNAINTVGYPVRSGSDANTIFRDSVFYSFHSTATEALDAQTTVQTQLTALATELNTASEDFDALTTTTH